LGLSFFFSSGFGFLEDRLDFVFNTIFLFYSRGKLLLWAFQFVLAASGVSALSFSFPESLTGSGRGVLVRVARPTTSSEVIFFPITRRHSRHEVSQVELEAGCM